MDLHRRRSDVVGDAAAETAGSQANGGLELIGQEVVPFGPHQVSFW